MSFPTTTIIDDFSRADSTSDFGTNWTSCFGDTDQGGILSGQAYSSDGGWRGQYWNPATFGPDCEIYLKIATVPAAGNKIFLGARMNGLPTSVTGYGLQTDPGDGTMFLSRLTGTGPPGTQLGALITQAISAGDSIGLECIGDQIAFWYKAAAGSWTQVAVRTDSVYSAAGYIGIEFQNTATRLDDLGGGTVDTLTLDTALPDADITTTGWTSTPLYSKLNDGSDATVVQATAS